MFNEHPHFTHNHPDQPTGRGWGGPRGPHAHRHDAQPHAEAGHAGFGPQGWDGPRPPFAHGGPGFEPPFVRGHHFGGPFGHGHGGPRFGGPWGRHGRHGGPEREARGEAFRTLRPSVEGLVALLRASDPAQAGQIKAVLDDARRRIAAILAETLSTPTPTTNV